MTRQPAVSDDDLRAWQANDPRTFPKAAQPAVRVYVGPTHVTVSEHAVSRAVSIVAILVAGLVVVAAIVRGRT